MRETALDKITKIAKDARDAIGIALSKDRLSLTEIEQQVEALRQYRDDYCRQLEIAMQRPISRPLYNDYHDFLKSLGETIELAEQQLIQQKELIEKRQQLWMEKHRKVAGFETLIKRKTEEEKQQQQKLERKISDEINTNASARKQIETR